MDPKRLPKLAEAAARPLWRSMLPTDDPDIMGVSGEAEFGWFPRASPVPVPHSWPPNGDGMIDIEVFAVCFNERMTPGNEPQAAPFARVVMAVSNGSVVEVISLGTKLRYLGLQTHSPAPDDLWPNVERAINCVLELVHAGSTPTLDIANGIRKGYCGFFDLNWLLARELLLLHPSFGTWLHCPG